MQSALIVSNTEKSIAFFAETLTDLGFSEITIVASGYGARQRIEERDFDLYIVNSPLPDEYGEKFAMFASGQGICQVILAAREETFEEVSRRVAGSGVFVIPKPISKPIFAASARLAAAAFDKMSILKAENAKLKKKIEDLRVIDRAKCLLVSCLRMTEPEAHKYIEKQAMDMREPRVSIALSVIRTYEN